MRKSSNYYLIKSFDNNGCSIEIYVLAQSAASACRAIINKGYRAESVTTVSKDEYMLNKTKSINNLVSLEVQKADKKHTTEHAASQPRSQASTDTSHPAPTQPDTDNTSRRKNDQMSKTPKEQTHNSHVISQWAIAISIAILSYSIFAAKDARSSARVAPETHIHNRPQAVPIAENVFVKSDGTVYELYKYGGSFYYRKIREHDWGN